MRTQESRDLKNDPAYTAMAFRTAIGLRGSVERTVHIDQAGRQLSASFYSTHII
jgi:hypothetical protein